MPGGLENLFPERLRRAAKGFFTEEFGVALLRLQDASGSGRPIDPGVDPIDPAFQGILHNGERAQAASYRLAKRRNEFLAGRAAAKLALAEYWAVQGRLQDMAAVEIVNDPTGRPLARPPAEEETAPPSISISHGGEYAAALATAATCGIDLQEQKDTLVRILDKYCTAEEAEILAEICPQMAPPVRLSLLWTAKEAAKKACSPRWMPGFLDLRLIPPVGRRQDWHVFTLAVSRAPQPFPGRISVLATTFHQYGLAVCTIKEKTHAGTAGS